MTVTEQVPPVGIAMNHPGRKLKTELTVGVQKLVASLPQPGAKQRGRHGAMPRRPGGPGFRHSYWAVPPK
jgi:hypothetical protein